MCKIEADREQRQLEFKMRQMELEAETARLAFVPTVPVCEPSSPAVSSNTFDISRQIALVPLFRESEVDSYFCVFERIAVALKWPEEVWCLLLQCKLTGKAQEVLSALPLEDSLNYEVVKATVLRAYELVPEAYRQRFRSHRKSSSKTYVEFARDKGNLFDKWHAASKVTDFNSLRELILLEEFKNCLPERIVVYLNEQKVSSLAEASVLADEFVLTHKSVFSAHTESRATEFPTFSPSRPAVVYQARQKNERSCFYCHKVGHMINDCFLLKRKQGMPLRAKPPTGVALIRTVVRSATKQVPQSNCSLKDQVPDRSYEPFIFEGFVSLTNDGASQRPVKILRDTGAAQSFILSDVLPLSDDTYCGSSVLVQGIEMGFVPVPLHFVKVHSELISGIFRVGVRPKLPVKGVTFIMGNDIAGGKVVPVLEVLDKSDHSLSNELAQSYPHVFPACAVTRAQALQEGDVIDLSNTVLFKEDDQEDGLCDTSEKLITSDKQPRKELKNVELIADAIQLPVTREQLIANQKVDNKLVKCFSSVVSLEEVKKKNVAYFIDGNLLMRKWKSHVDAGGDWNAVYQIVIPTAFRQNVLSLAHDHQWSGHLGITKTYDRILRHFFWPGLKQDVAQFCRTCHTCQITGKPKQVIPPAPLCPIPVIGEPFEHVVVDCVGPLPKTKSGNQFLLTIMFMATRYPEAIPLRKITAPVVSKQLRVFVSCVMIFVCFVRLTLLLIL
uniref:Gypsy retrotransposon integrase-like protein 1 n=1 Tax=Oncorhynchus mykiss TaxID=8022 RepID=A0A8K9V3F6_ONCMY